jgi:hypothetical protein
MIAKGSQTIFNKSAICLKNELHPSQFVVDVANEKEVINIITAKIHTIFINFFFIFKYYLK